jgi:hypothetical protein
MESPTHAQLKRVAAALLLREGFNAVATEVRTPVMRYRADVAGYLDRAPLPEQPNHLAGVPTLYDPPDPDDRAPRRPRTAIIECKASRADLLRDAADLERAAGELERLHELRRRYERRVLAPREPHLRQQGGYLFREMEGWSFSRSRSPEYRRLIERIESAERALHGSVKFGRLTRYAMADRLFVLTLPGLVRPRELPAGWGLLECPASMARQTAAPLPDLARAPIAVAREADDLATTNRARRRLLRNIAVANTTSLLRS